MTFESRREMHECLDVVRVEGEISPRAFRLLELLVAEIDSQFVSQEAPTMPAPRMTQELTSAGAAFARARKLLPDSDDK